METPPFSFLEELQGTLITVYIDVLHILLVWFKGHVQDQSMP